MRAHAPPSAPAEISKSFLIVGAGLAAIGIGSLGFLAIVSRALTERDFARFGVWFALVNVVSFGLFVPLETAIARALLSGAEFVGQMRRETFRYMFVAFGVVLAIGLVFERIVLPRLMNDSWGLVAITLCYSSLLALQTIQRGVAVGRSLYWPLFWQFAVDGAFRLSVPAMMIAAGNATIEAFAFSIVASAALGLVAGQLAISRAKREPARCRTRVGLDRRALVSLVVAAIGVQLLANGAPPILSLAGRDSATVLAGVVGALALTRVPLLFSSAIQAPLLPPMVRLIRSGETTALWRLLARILAGFGALGCVAFVTGWYFGASVLRTYLGDDYGAHPISMAMLASAGVALLAVIAVQAAVVAIEAHGTLASAWFLGIAVFLGMTAIPVDGLILAPIAIMVATVVTLAAMLIGLRWATNAHSSEPQ